MSETPLYEMSRIRAMVPKVIHTEDIVFIDSALDFVEAFDFPTDLLLSVIRHPTETTLDPHSLEVGYPFLRFRRGDITVVVGFLNPDAPAVTFVYLHTPDGDQKPKGMGGAGGVGGKTPKSTQQLLGWAQAQGCEIKYNGRGHYSVYWHGTLLGSTGSTQHSRSAMNDYSFLRKRLAAEQAKETAERVKAELSDG